MLLLFLENTKKRFAVNRAENIGTPDIDIPERKTKKITRRIYFKILDYN